MRLLYLAGLVLIALMLAAPAGAKRPPEPTKLWSEFPLVQKTGQAAPLRARPFIPPAGPEPTVASERSIWRPWMLLAAVGAIALLFAARSARPAAAAGGHAVDRGARALAARARGLRVRVPVARPAGRGGARPRARPSLRRHKPGPGVQYAPLTVVAEPEPQQSTPYITRRSGLMRSRYVVMTEKSDGERELRRSKAFWQVGREAWQRRTADDAWDELANDLRADGWEVDVTGRYEYFVPLRRAIISTLEPYTRRERAEPHKR